MAAAATTVTAAATGGDSKSAAAVDATAAAAAAVVPKYNLTGDYDLDWTKSDDVEPLLAAWDMGWTYRKIAKQLNLIHHVRHTATEFVLNAETAVGTVEWSFRLGADYTPLPASNGCGPVRHRSWVDAGTKCLHIHSIRTDGSCNETTQIIDLVSEKDVEWARYDVTVRNPKQEIVLNMKRYFKKRKP